MISFLHWIYDHGTEYGMFLFVLVFIRMSAGAVILSGRKNTDVLRNNEWRLAFFIFALAPLRPEKGGNFALLFLDFLLIPIYLLLIAGGTAFVIHYI